jgi:hypothetical protein
MCLVVKIRLNNFGGQPWAVGAPGVTWHPYKQLIVNSSWKALLSLSVLKPMRGKSTTGVGHLRMQSDDLS